MDNWQPVINSVMASVIIGIIGAVAGYAISKLKGFREEHNSLVGVGQQFNTIVSEHSVVIRAIRDMIRSSITRVCDEALHDGCIKENQLRNLCELYESYKSLGGNSYVDELFNHTTELPLTGSSDPGVEYMRRFGLLGKDYTANNQQSGR